MKRSAAPRPIWFAFLAVTLVAALAAAETTAGGKSEKVTMATVKGFSIGAKFDPIEKQLGPGKRASTADVPKLSDPAEEEALAKLLKTVRPNLLYKWDNGTDRLVIGIQTADSGD